MIEDMIRINCKQQCFCGLLARPTRVSRVLISPVTGHQAINIFEIIMFHKEFR